jgi:hypothetical protein
LRWRTVYPEALSWRELEGELVVRNACTGSTHLLNSLAGEVFRALVEAEAGIGVAELTARLDEDTSSIEAVLADFERLGLASATH